MSDFKAAAAALAALRSSGIAVRTHTSGNLILQPETSVTANHRRIVQDHGASITALLALQQAASRAERGRVTR